uniref:Reverse transcriptase domain-containing protein n=1 Tax=Salarias fasciatus TaxID=181472 RepID=A0A672FN99_SALFA
MRELWKILNNVIHKSKGKVCYPKHFTVEGKENDNMMDVANCFNKFFVNIGSDLAEKIPDVGRDTGNHNFINRNLSSMFLRNVEEKEVIQVVSACKNKTSRDCNDIDMILVKNVIECISKPLTYICNLSFQTGTFPNQMKVAKVIPVYKAGDKHDFTNYRPVSLLSQFSKILEKLFVARLNTFLEKNKILNESQYGFRSKRSTALALLDSVEEIANSLENKMYTIGIFLDLQKAFDTINHDILIDKLERYGIRGRVLDWVKSYLTDRKQFVQLGDFCSLLLDVSCGVPQGAVLGPILFILYINDICKVSDVLKLVLFADDTTIFCTGDDLQALEQEMNTELKKIKSWLDRNKLSLNLGKTKLMVFGNMGTNDVEIKLDDKIIEKVNEIKFLGVLIDDKINWKSHISHVQRKVSRSISVINKAKHDLNKNSLRILYCSLVLPYFTYCAEVWGNNYKTALHPLVILQKKAIRIIHGVGYREHTNILFANSKLLKFQDIVDLLTVQIVFRASKDNLPKNIQLLFSKRVGVGYNLRHTQNFKVRWANNKRKRLCPSVQGVKLWNNLGRQ